jgi:hypothetical protein
LPDALDLGGRSAIAVGDRLERLSVEAPWVDLGRIVAQLPARETVPSGSSPTAVDVLACRPRQTHAVAAAVDRASGASHLAVGKAALDVLVAIADAITTVRRTRTAVRGTAAAPFVVAADAVAAHAASAAVLSARGAVLGGHTQAVTARGLAAGVHREVIGPGADPVELGVDARRHVVVAEHPGIKADQDTDLAVSPWHENGATGVAVTAMCLQVVIIPDDVGVDIIDVVDPSALLADTIEGLLVRATIPDDLDYIALRRRTAEPVWVYSRKRGEVLREGQDGGVVLEVVLLVLRVSLQYAGDTRGRAVVDISAWEVTELQDGAGGRDVRGRKHTPLADQRRGTGHQCYVWFSHNADVAELSQVGAIDDRSAVLANLFGGRGLTTQDRKHYARNKKLKM